MLNPFNSRLQAKEKPTLPTTSSQTSGLRNCEKVNSCCLSTRAVVSRYSSPCKRIHPPPCFFSLDFILLQWLPSTKNITPSRTETTNDLSQSSTWGGPDVKDSIFPTSVWNIPGALGVCFVPRGTTAHSLGTIVSGQTFRSFSFKRQRFSDIGKYFLLIYVQPYYLVLLTNNISSL